MQIELDKENIYAETVLEISRLIEGTPWENRVYLVGGAVRDLLLGLPMHDIDLAINSRDGAEEFAKWICQETDCYKEGCNPVIFPTYGTAKFNILSIHKLSNVEIECVQTRRERYDDSTTRNPITVFGTIQEDAERRDLTINALYVNISNGEILDPTEKGLHDIDHHIIQTPCSADFTFSDDPLRMLRVIRFATKLGWGIEKDTWLGIINNVHRLSILSQERITEELTKILLCPTPSVGIERLRYSGCLEKVLPEFNALKLVKQGVQHFGNAYEHTLSVIDKSQPSKLNRWAALFHDIGKLVTRTEVLGSVKFIKHEIEGAELAEGILTRMKFSNKDKKSIASAVKEHMRFKQNGDKAPSAKALRRFVEDVDPNDIDLILDIINADNNSHADGFCLPRQVKLIKNRLNSMKDKDGQTKRLILPISGKDIMEEFHLKSGPEIGMYMRIVHDLCVKKPNTTKEEALEALRVKLTV